MTTIEIHLPSFKAAALSTAGKADGREVLQSVAIVQGDDGRIGYMGCDSHVLAMIVPSGRNALADGELVDWFKLNADPTKLLLVPAELVAKIVKWKPTKGLSQTTHGYMTLTFEEDGQSRMHVRAEHRLDGITLTARCTEGHYPRVSSLLPDKVAQTADPVLLTGKYLSLIVKGAEAIGHGLVTFWNGESILKPQFLSSHGTDANGVWLLMPCRPNGGTAPTWKPETKAEVAA